MTGFNCHPLQLDVTTMIFIDILKLQNHEKHNLLNLHLINTCDLLPKRSLHLQPTHPTTYTYLSITTYLYVPYIYYLPSCIYVPFVYNLPNYTHLSITTYLNIRTFHLQPTYLYVPFIQPCQKSKNCHQLFFMGSQVGRQVSRCVALATFPLLCHT